MNEDEVDPVLLEEYRRRLSAISYDRYGMVTALVLSPQPDEHRMVSELAVIPEVGVEGQYPGKQWWRGKRVPGRQISAINAEALEVLEIPYDVPGDNLIIQGIDLSQFHSGDLLRIGDSFLVTTPTPHRPCSKLARRTSPTKKAALSEGRLRGILLDAKDKAVIRLGDSVERLIQGQS